jgi:exonuclease SbcC
VRPLTLDVEGFGAFRERTTVDFAGADLFAIVGATGHGKSTLIDAICFALYGKVPRHGERDIAPVMTLGSNETRVFFTFELGDDVYIATRILRRKATGDGATTRDLRLERHEADGSTEIVAGKKDEFDTAIRRLVGLDFDQFTKCVVLPQGQFAAFLHAPNANRVAILSALLDLGRYDRMGAAARERAKVASGRLHALSEERTRLGDVTDQQLAEATRRREALVALRAEIDAAGPRDAELEAGITADEARAEAARRAVAALAVVKIPEAARQLADQLDAARAAVADAEAAADAAESVATDAEAARDALPTLDALTDAVGAHRERAGVAARIAKGAEVLAEREAAAATAKDALEAATAELEAGEAALADAQHRHAHAELRSSLQVGEPCPVCEHEVTALPPKLRPTELAQVKKSVAAQKQEREKTNTAASKALADFRSAEELLQSLQEQAAEFTDRIEVFPDAEQAAALLVTARAAQRAAQTTRADATNAHAAVRTATQHLAEFGEAEGKAEAVMQAQRDGVIAAGLEPPAGDWDDLVAWAEAARPEHDKQAAELDACVRVRSAERDELFDDLATRAREAGVSEPAERTLNALTLAHAQYQHSVEEQARRVAEKLARAKELDEEIKTAKRAEAVAADLGRLLDKAHFGQWLVDEALRGLVEGASTLLERLSGGQYALRTSAEGDLLVVDHVNADETRSVRSLSGGETFQASLALALALADRIADLAADGAAALESIFLDEGFGTLDPETLDVVAGTIESLGHNERVVGVVTHVADLAERMPVRFRVRKVGRTSVVIREET